MFKDYTEIKTKLFLSIRDQLAPIIEKTADKNFIVLYKGNIVNVLMPMDKSLLEKVITIKLNNKNIETYDVFDISPNFINDFIIAKIEKDYSKE